MRKPITKLMMESMCRKAGMIPEKRHTINGEDIFIADGFSKIPHIAYMKFGVDPEEFPNGAYCTIWFTAKGDNLDYGLPLIFDAHHDLTLGRDDARKKARLNLAIQEAKKSLATRAVARANRIITNV